MNSNLFYEKYQTKKRSFQSVQINVFLKAVLNIRRRRHRRRRLYRRRSRRYFH